MRRLAAVLAFACGALAGCAPAGDAGVTELRYATPYSPSHPFSRADSRWMQFVEERSGGTLRVKPSWSGALLSSEHSLVELRHGVVDVGLVTPIYAHGGVHLIRAQAAFYGGVRTIEQQVALYRCLAASEPQFEREMAGLVVLAVQGGNLLGLITRDRPVADLAALRGMRIRVPAELVDVLREIGADPVSMPMGDVYSALAKGIIDGVMAPKDTFRSLHLAEVARYYTTLIVPRGAYPSRAIARKRWDALTDAQRAVLEESIAVWEAALADENRRAQEEGWAYALAEGVVEVPISAEDQAEFDAIYAREAERSAARLSRYGIDGARVLDFARRSIAPDGHIECRGGSR